MFTSLDLIMEWKMLELQTICWPLGKEKELHLLLDVLFTTNEWKGCGEMCLRVAWSLFIQLSSKHCFLVSSSCICIVLIIYY